MLPGDVEIVLQSVVIIKVLRPGHCLHQLLPERKLVSTKLRPSNHSCSLLICKYVCYKRSVSLIMFENVHAELA